MPRGRLTTLTITLHDADRTVLAQWQRADDAALARRARLITLVAEGKTIATACRATGLMRRHAYKWLRRYRQAGCKGLEDLRQYNVPSWVTQAPAKGAYAD